MSHPKSCCRGKQGFQVIYVQFSSVRSMGGFPSCSSKKWIYRHVLKGLKIGHS